MQYWQTVLKDVVDACSASMLTRIGIQVETLFTAGEDCNEIGLTVDRQCQWKCLSLLILQRLVLEAEGDYPFCALITVQTEVLIVRQSWSSWSRLTGVLTCKKSEYNMIWIRWTCPKIVAPKTKSTKECIVDFRVRPKHNRKTRTLKRFENNLHTFPQTSVQTKEVTLYQASWLSPGPMVLDTWTKIRNPIHHIEYCKERGKRHPWVTLQRVGVEVKIVHFGLLNNGLSSQHGPCFVVV